MFKNLSSVLQDSHNEYFIFLAQDDYRVPNHLGGHCAEFSLRIPQLLSQYPALIFTLKDL